MLSTVKQDRYPDLRIGNNEQDILIITMPDKDHSGNVRTEVIPVERDKVPALINALTSALSK